MALFCTPKRTFRYLVCPQRRTSSGSTSSSLARFDPSSLRVTKDLGEMTAVSVAPLDRKRLLPRNRATAFGTCPLTVEKLLGGWGGEGEVGEFTRRGGRRGVGGKERWGGGGGG